MVLTDLGSRATDPVKRFLCWIVCKNACMAEHVPCEHLKKNMPPRPRNGRAPWGLCFRIMAVTVNEATDVCGSFLMQMAMQIIVIPLSGSPGAPDEDRLGSVVETTQMATVVKAV